ncbi:MAG: GYD domain-containing protein, partial [Hyphomicrobiales bacterium]|nr:GYD domain-containing protein [Hyphomicrobiales bacterium]
MATYVMLSTLGPQGSATLSDNPERLSQFNEDVERMGATVLHQWALLGQW